MNAAQFLSILRARWAAATLTIVVAIGLTGIASLLWPKKYTATATVLVDFKTPDPITGALLPMIPGSMATQIDIIKSHRVALEVVRGLKLAQSPGAREQFMAATEGRGTIEDYLAELIAHGLDAEPGRESTVIDINYSGADPRFAMALANAFAQAYIDTNISLKAEPARQLAAWFDDRSKTLRENLDRAQAKLSEYQKKEGLVAADERLDVENTRLAELSTQATMLQAQSSDTENKLRQVKEFLARGAPLDTLPEVLANPFIQGLKTEILKGEANLKQLSQSLGTNHPGYQRAQVENESLRARLNEEIRKVTDGLENAHRVNLQKLSDARGALAAQKARLLGSKGDRDELNVLLREVETAQKAYDLAMSRYQQSSLESQANQTNVVLLNAAVEPITHSSPKTFRNLVIAAFLGTLLGIGLAFMLETIDAKIRTNEDAQEALGAALLGSMVSSARLWRPGRRISNILRWLRLSRIRRGTAEA